MFGRHSLDSNQAPKGTARCWCSRLCRLFQIPPEKIRLPQL